MMDTEKRRCAVVAGMLLVACSVASAQTPARFAVNEYFGVRYDREPVSCDVAFDKPVAADKIGLRPGPCQVEVLEGSLAAVKKARLWTLVTMDPNHRHIIFTVTTDGSGAAGKEQAATVGGVEKIGGVEVSTVTNSLISAKIPTLGATFEEPASAFVLPGPVASIRRDANDTNDSGKWIGSGYLDSTMRVEKVTCQTSLGPVYFESKITYAFDGGRSYRVRARVYPSKPYVQLVEDFDVGGASRFVFNYGDWRADGFFRTEDAKHYDWWSITHDDPVDDFVKIEGQKCLARMVIWSQHGYFRGKQEAIGLKGFDRKAMDDQYAAELADWRAEMEKFPTVLEAWKKSPKGAQPAPPAEPAKPAYEETNYAVDGAAIRAALMKRPGQQRPYCTPGGASTAVGAFYIRPDRWTRAKVNHVDLYLRPETPLAGATSAGAAASTPLGASRQTRGAVGLAGAVLRPAMEAWLVDGHREWAIFAVPSGSRTWLAKAYVREGIWPLDRINRLSLVWNVDGSPVRPEDSGPCGSVGFAGDIATVLSATSGRAGVQHFNGSNPSMRGGYAKQARPLLDWAKANADKRSAAEVRKLGKTCEVMAGPAMAAYMAADDSAYPGPRAMLPWADPEALNPFYQGMENMNFNIDRYGSIMAVAAALDAMGHGDAKKLLEYCRQELTMGLDRYVYPQSGCWEESLTYAGSILRACREVGREFRDRGMGNLFADGRVINAYRWWTYMLSPSDPGFGDMRIVPPVGDHGLGLTVQAANLEATIPDFLSAGSDDAKRLAGQLAWSLRQRKCADKVPADLKDVPADLSSRWVQGYGSLLRGTDAKGRESLLVVRAGQSWGHHHQDKGSLWGWFRNVHFFGDAAWGSVPGPTYWNPYKQGPASGTQIEFVGVNNWPLPCKYAAAWVADEEYAKEFDYTVARCLYPYNPELDLSKSSPAALRNGYDRQVMLVHPDLLIVRDNVETTCPTIWRLHSYQVDGTKVETGGATLASPQGVTGTLAMVHPPGVKFTTTAVHDLPLDDGTKVNLPFGHKAGATDDPHKGGATAYDTRSMVLRWDMPASASVTWTFAVHEGGEKPAVSQRLDEDGHVTRITLSDGTRIVVLMNVEPFAFKGEGIEFEGAAGLVIRKDGKSAVYPIRCKTLTAK